MSYAVRLRLPRPAHGVLAALDRHPDLFDIGPDRGEYARPHTGVTVSLRAEGDVLRVEAAVLRPGFWADELGAAVEMIEDAAGADGGQAAAVAASYDEANAAAWRLAPMARPAIADDLCRRWWAWNRRIVDLEPLYPSAHVPEARIFELAGEHVLGAVWTDLGPTLLPPVDVVAVLIARLAARGLPPGLIVLRQQQVEELLGPLGDDGTAVAAAAGESDWHRLVRQGDRVAPPLPTLHPEEGVQARFVRAASG